MDRLDQIFARQAEYVTALAPTYVKNGFARHACPFPWEVDSRKDQEEFRLLAWRYTEELVEAQNTWFQPHSPQRMLEYREEMADALHFFVEICLATGIGPDELCTGIFAVAPECRDRLDFSFKMVGSHYEAPMVSDTWFEAIRAVALAMMRFKQRPWRIDYRPTDRAGFMMAMHLAWFSFVRACIYSNITAEELYHAYFRKAKTNDQRIVDFGIRA